MKDIWWFLNDECAPQKFIGEDRNGYTVKETFSSSLRSGKSVLVIYKNLNCPQPGSNEEFDAKVKKFLDKYGSE